MPVCNLSLQIIPVVPEEQVYPIVDRVIAMIAESKMKYVVGPMETTMEGELDDLMDVVKKAQALCADIGAERVLSVIKIDYRAGGVTMDEKMAKYKK
ncbi:MAG: thiamine-binding protein [Bacillota bacterium]